MKWWYHDAVGHRVFQHYRVSDPTRARGKRYGYRYPKLVENRVVLEWAYEKHRLADGLIYRLPWIVRHPRETLLLTEGERDSDAAWRLKVLASCHHGGAGKFTEAQAESLARHRGDFVLVADNDPAGAYDVCRRFDLLRAAGIPAKHLRVCEVVPRHVGADLRDHLDGGYGLDDLRVADLDLLRDMAAACTRAASEGSWPERRTTDEAEDLKHWRPQVVRRSGEPPAQRSGGSREEGSRGRCQP